MNRREPLVILLVVAALILAGAILPLPTAADLAPGEVIDKTNYQKLEGLVPDVLLNWIKKGDSIKIGKLDYDPAEFMPPACIQNMETNKGKYTIDKDGVLADVNTGKLPKFVMGLPFPEIDLKDPLAGFKIMYNKNYYTYGVGSIRVPFQPIWIARRGLEREMDMDYWVYVKDGYPGAKEGGNPNNIEIYSMMRALAPFDVKGTNILLWRYRSKKQDSTFAYVPAIRRVRRMSPANRSDAFLGTDFCVDDAWGYAGKVNNFQWKVLKKAGQIVPFIPGPPFELKQNDEGEWITANNRRKVTYGYQVDGYQGAPWFPADLIFLMRPTYVLECRAKDPYYNYGLQYLWIDAEFYQPTYKVIHDRSGKYWKTEWQSQCAFHNADKSIMFMGLGNMMAFDDRSDHATNIILVDPRNYSTFYMHQDPNDYSLAGFQKMCK